MIFVSNIYSNSTINDWLTTSTSTVALGMSETVNATSTYDVVKKIATAAACFFSQHYTCTFMKAAYENGDFNDVRISAGLCVLSSGLALFNTALIGVDEPI